MTSYWEVNQRWFSIRKVEMEEDPTSWLGDSTYYRTFREAKAALLQDLKAQKVEIEEQLAKLAALKKGDVEKVTMRGGLSV